MADVSQNHRISGLVLAGGRSKRMGADKGALHYGDSSSPQVRDAWELLEQVCGQAWVSVNAAQAAEAPYAKLPVIKDTMPDRGPAAGLLSAFEFDSTTAWLVLAVDMPRVSRSLLSNLISQRDTSRVATVHCHADGTIEPLCAIWEAHAQAPVRLELDSGRGSLRALAEEQSAAIARLPEPGQLRNVNTPAERALMERHLSEQGADVSSSDTEGA